MTGERVRLLGTNGEVSKETFIVNYREQDRKGNPLLENEVRKVRSHPSRILPLTAGAAPVFRGGADRPVLLAKCPSCNNDVRVDVKNVRQAECPEHGAFDLSWANIDPGRIPIDEDAVNSKLPKKASVKKKSTKTRTPRAAKTPAVIDFAAIRAVGELWTRSGIEFDYPDFDVRAHVLILVGNGPPRKYCFNSYNGTWGKKPKDHELACFLTNRPTDAGTTVGWAIKGTLDQERQRLIKGGYKRDEG